MSAENTHPSSTDGLHPDQAFCVCGSAWFNQMIAFTHAGEPNGVGGAYTCIECGEQYPFGWRGAVTESGAWFDPGSPA